MLPREKSTMKRIYGPRAFVKHKHPDDWPSGIMPPPLLVSRASKSCTTSSISGRLSGFASQHFRITFANALGQQRGMSGRRFCTHKQVETIRCSEGLAHACAHKALLICSAQYVQYVDNYQQWIQKLKTNLMNNGGWDIRKTEVWIWHVTAVYFP